MRQVGYVRLFADAQGESHFAEIDVDLDPVEFAPPAPPLHIAALFPATACGLVSGPPDWDGSIPHPAPRRQLFCTLRGAYEVTASDGTVRRFP
ncbi:MAG: cupin domain-containing protein, partial [Chloroflexia bacterium]|nr:cupin domain-containing protein [Chloroflexia bacterium]